MSITKVLARDWKFEIRTATAPDVYALIKGIETFSNGAGAAMADTTTFDEGGVESHLVASRNYTLKLDGKFLEDVATNIRDAGQQAVETLSSNIGPSSLGSFRMTSPGGTLYTFNASAVVSAKGDGGKNDASKWGVDLKVSGTITQV